MRSITLLFACLCLSIIQVSAQTKEENDVATACSSLNKAIIDADQGMLEKLTLKELSYGHSSGLIENQSQFIAALTSGNTDFTNIEITDQTIKVTGKNAIVRSTFKGILLKEGKPIEIKIGILMVWKNAKGNWKLLARQGYKI